MEESELQFQALLRFGLELSCVVFGALTNIILIPEFCKTSQCIEVYTKLSYHIQWNSSIRIPLKYGCTSNQESLYHPKNCVCFDL